MLCFVFFLLVVEMGIRSTSAQSCPRLIDSDGTLLQGICNYLLVPFGGFIYKPGETKQFYLSAKSSLSSIGAFNLEILTPNGRPVGRFLSSLGVQVCSGGDMIRNDPQFRPASSQFINWEAPTSDKGLLSIRLTIGQSADSFFDFCHFDNVKLKFTGEATTTPGFPRFGDTSCQLSSTSPVMKPMPLTKCRFYQTASDSGDGTPTRCPGTKRFDTMTCKCRRRRTVTCNVV